MDFVRTLTAYSTAGTQRECAICGMVKIFGWDVAKDGRNKSGMDFYCDDCFCFLAHKSSFKVIIHEPSVTSHA